MFRVLDDGLLERSSSAFTGPGVHDEVGLGVLGWRASGSGLRVSCRERLLLELTPEFQPLIIQNKSVYK